MDYEIREQVRGKGNGKQDRPEEEENPVMHAAEGGFSEFGGNVPLGVMDSDGSAR